MIDANLYDISTKLIVGEDESLFEARVRELPDVCEYAETRLEAIDLAIETIEATAEMLRDQGKPMPPPLGEDVSIYSGRVTLRLPKHLHEMLALQALQDDTSLNSYINSLLSFNFGANQAVEALSSRVHIFNNTYGEVASFTINKMPYVSALDNWETSVPALPSIINSDCVELSTS